MSSAVSQLIRRVAISVLLAPIQLYRMAISPMFAPVCRFTPSCSDYAVEALKTHGPFRGVFLTARRVSRCHPFTWLGGSSGFDPVPPR